MAYKKLFNYYLVNQVRQEVKTIYDNNNYHIICSIFIYILFFNIYIGVRPLNQLPAYTNHHIPGVTLTTCNFESNYDSTIWPGSRKVGTSRCWPHDSHSSDHSDQSGQRESDHSAHSGEHRDSGTI